ncbi:MAG: hypothetical protein PHV18_05680 [Lachnospiraceae bacterium]|nr:hypothetical protein [Lachnospiraceae bacterium]
MASIRDTILKRYGIDISQENLFKIYRLTGGNIPAGEVKQRLDDQRRKWEQTVNNSSNAKLLEKAEDNLKKASKYEEILMDPMLRSKLYQYYHSTAEANDSPKFAKEYFDLIKSTKEIDRSDVDFFFQYFAEQRKNKKEILLMLKKNYKVRGLAKEGENQEDDYVELEGKKKNPESLMIVNQFKEATVIKIKKCLEQFQSSRQRTGVRAQYSELDGTLYQMLELDDIENLEQFVELIKTWRQDVYTQKQEKGEDFAPLVDLFNTLADISEYQDVVDNFDSFKLLFKYPELTPYMYGLVNIKPRSLQKLYEIANQTYAFRDIYDFLLNYFLPIYQHFNIQERAIKGVIHKAQTKATANKILNRIDEKLGRDKQKRSSMMVNAVHFLVYWPIFMMYAVFGLFRFTVQRFLFIALPLGAILAARLSCAYLCFQNSWWLNWGMGVFRPDLELIRLSIQRLQIQLQMLDTSGLQYQKVYLFLYIIVFPVLAGLFVILLFWRVSKVLLKTIDWIGIDRTFKNICHKSQLKTERQYEQWKNKLFRKSVLKFGINLLSVILCVCFVSGVSFGLCSIKKTADTQDEQLSDMKYFLGFYIINTDFYKSKEQQEKWKREVEENIEGWKKSWPERKAAIEKELARTGPAWYVSDFADCYVFSRPNGDHRAGTISRGVYYLGTGNRKMSSSGISYWYEIYLDDTKTETGWGYSLKEVKLPCFTITVDEANIRSGAGNDFDVLRQAKPEDCFVGTGNEGADDVGTIWHEIYLDGTQTQTGWVSETIIRKDN